MEVLSRTDSGITWFLYSEEFKGAPREPNKIYGEGTMYCY